MTEKKKDFPIAAIQLHCILMTQLNHSIACVEHFYTVSISARKQAQARTASFFQGPPSYFESGVLTSDSKSIWGKGGGTEGL